MDPRPLQLFMPGQRPTLEQARRAGARWRARNREKERLRQRAYRMTAKWICSTCGTANWPTTTYCKECAGSVPEKAPTPELGDHYGCARLLRRLKEVHPERDPDRGTQGTNP